MFELFIIRRRVLCNMFEVHTVGNHVSWPVYFRSISIYKRGKLENGNEQWIIILNVCKSRKTRKVHVWADIAPQIIA